MIAIGNSAINILCWDFSCLDVLGLLLRKCMYTHYQFTEDFVRELACECFIREYFASTYPSHEMRNTLYYVL